MTRTRARGVAVSVGLVVEVSFRGKCLGKCDVMYVPICYLLIKER